MSRLLALPASSMKLWSMMLTPALLWTVHHFKASTATVIVQFDDSHSGLYSILWILVFGFATLNIISLGARRLEPKKTSLNMGEMMAVLVVLFSVFLLGWELLHLYHIFPIRLGSH